MSGWPRTWLLASLATMGWTPVVAWREDVVAPVQVGLGLTKAQAAGRGWVRTSKGCYVPAHVDRTVPEQRILEHAERLPAGGAVTGWAALRLLGGRYFDGLARDGVSALPVPLAMAHRHRMRPRPGEIVLRSDLSEDEVESRHGVPVVSAERAVFDEIRRVGELREAVVPIDMAVVAGFTTLERMAAFIRSRSCKEGVVLARSALELAVDRSASPMETRFRLIWVLDAGLPMPRCNWPVADAGGNYVGKPDLLDEGLGIVGEFDGKDHRGRERHRQDVGREGRFSRVGFEGCTVVGGDIADRTLVVARIRDAIDRRASSSRPRTWMLRHNPPPLWRG